MDCTNPIEPDGRRYKIVHWTAPKEFTVHMFPDGFRIFNDDSIETVLIKIAVLLGRNSIPYAWSRRTPLLFDIVPSTAWEGYRANPWKAKQINGFSSPTLHYKTHHLIGNMNIFSIHVVFPEDIRSLKLPLSAYFPNIDIKIPTPEALAKKEKYLYTLWNVPQEQHIAIQRNDNGCTYTRAVFQMVPTSTTTKYALSTIFTKAKTSSQIPFIQWCFDSSHIVYKVLKNHTIPESKLAQWTTVPKVEEEGLVMYSLVTGDIYARVHVNPKLECIVTYHMETRDKIPYNVVHNHVNALHKRWMNMVSQNFALSDREVAIRTELNVKEVDFKKVVTYLTNLLPIFNVTKYEKNRVDLFYKRSSIFTDVTLADHIQSLRDMDMDDQAIVERLIQEHNVKPTDIEAAIQELDQGTRDQPSIRLETGMWMQLLVKSNVMKVTVKNAPSHEEARQAVHWLRAAVSEALTKAKQQAPKPKALKLMPLDIAGPSKRKTPTPSNSESSSESQVIHQNDDDLDFLSEGGALGNFISPLHNADADIFNKATYSSKCSVTNNRQPVVISPEEFQKYMETGKDRLMDNYIRYGSRPTNENIYFCPRVWCPQSKVPLNPGEECPLEGEKPLQMYKHNYWGNDPKKPHYVGFHKDVNEKGLCLPCCYLANQAQNEEEGKKRKLGAKQLHFDQCMKHTHVQGDVKAPNKKVKMQSVAPSDPAGASTSAAVDVQENYLMQDEALPLGRNGSIPEVLHEIVLPDVKYQICSKQLSAQPCVVRRGVGKSQDPIMSAIAYALGKESKPQLFKMIQQHLTPLTFMTLEDGMVMAAFLPMQPIIPSKEPKLCKSYTEWVSKYKEYIKLFELQPVIEFANAGKWDNKRLQYRLSRELSLYIAYQQFLHHLSSDEPKNTHFMYHLLKSMGILFVMWEKDNADQISVQCPYFSDVVDLLQQHEEQRKTVMLVKDGTHIDPLELKKRNAEGVPLLDSKYMTKLDMALGQCPAPLKPRNHQDIASLSYLKRWMDSILIVPSTSKFSKAVIHPDLMIRQILLHNGAVLHLPSPIPIGYASKLHHELEVKFTYQEDIEDTSVIVRIPKVDHLILASRLRQNGYGYDFGEDAFQNDPNLTITRIKYKPSSLPPVIPIYDEDDVSIRKHADEKKNRNWQMLQRLVAKELLKYYDDLPGRILHKSRKDGIFELMNTFHKLPRDKVQVVLEEIPWQYGPRVLAQWILNIGVHDWFYQRYVSNAPNKKEWVFSQTMVEKGLPSELVQPLKGPRPSLIFQKSPQAIQYIDPPSVPPSLPFLINPENVNEEDLLSKFKQWSSSWSIFKQWVPKEPQGFDRLLELLEWISRKCSSTWYWEDIMVIRFKTIDKVLTDKTVMQSLLMDPYFYSIWKDGLKKYSKDKLSSIEEIWTVLSKINAADRSKIWNDMHNNHKHRPMDIDFLIMAQLMGCTFMLMYRVKHGASEGTRGSLEDLSMSTSLFSFSTDLERVKNKPVFMFFRHSKENAYYPIVNSDNDTFAFNSWKELPKSIVEFMEYALETKRIAMM